MILPLLVGAITSAVPQRVDSSRTATGSGPSLPPGAAAPAPTASQQPTRPAAKAAAAARPDGGSSLAARMGSLGRKLTGRGSDEYVVSMAGKPVHATLATDLLATVAARPGAPRRIAAASYARPAIVAPSDLAPTAADSIVVEKSRRRMTLYFMGRAVRSYSVALGKNPVGDKVSIGDDRTPEGLFHIDWRNAYSKYHLALRISYPDERHLARAASLGMEPGGDIMIHGLPDRFASYGKSHTEWDWTNGCVAVSNEEIEELWHVVPVGTPVEIKP